MQKKIKELEKSLGSILEKEEWLKFMIYKDENYLIIDKELFDEVLSDSNENEFYNYHYILVKYQDNEDILTMKIDQVKDLSKLDGKNVLCKYYIQKIHFYTESGNYLSEHGEPYYIYNIGYFYIGGEIPTDEDEKIIIKKKFEEYNKEYSNMEFPFDDEMFLSLNKSVINF